MIKKKLLTMVKIKLTFIPFKFDAVNGVAISSHDIKNNIEH